MKTACRNQFKGFHEAPITFKPTYKFDSGTNNYDSSPKNRIPAYTDRILWLTKEPDSVECLSYSSHPTITISDHKPISADFRVRTEKINKQIYNSVYKEVTSWLDKHENELIPQVAVSSKAIDFGKLKFLERATANIQLQNTGKTPAQFQIIDSKVFSPDRDVYEAFNSNIGLSIDPNKVKNLISATCLQKQAMDSFSRRISDKKDEKGLKDKKTGSLTGFKGDRAQMILVLLRYPVQTCQKVSFLPSISV